MLLRLQYIAFFVSVSVPLVYGDIFTWTDESGRVHYSDKAPTKKQNKAIETVQLEPINSYQKVDISVIQANFTKIDHHRQRSVIMYSTERCGYCKKARMYFEKNRIPFEERDIDKSVAAREEFDRLGGQGVPVILVGSQRMNGFSEKRFATLYGR